MVYDKARRTEGGTGGFGVARKGEGRGREGEETSGNGSIESAAQRNAPPLALVWQLCGRTTTSACVRKRERERERERGRDGEKGGEKGTDGSGREIDVYPPTNTNARGGGREESQAESRWARSGLPEFHTHRALLRVSSRRGELHEGGGATPTRKEGRREFPIFASGFAKTFAIFRKEGSAFAERASYNGSSLIGAEECNCSRKPATVRALSDDASRGMTRGRCLDRQCE